MKNSLLIQLKKSAIVAIGVCASLPAWSAAIVRIDGSSTVFPITEAVAEEFQIKHKGAINVTVGISGTGGGFKKFCRGEIDVANASRPILKKEMEVCAAAGVKYLELPVAFDALTVVANPANSAIKQLTVAELKKMWEPAAQGKVKSWRDINPSFPDQPLSLYGPGSDSGTFDYFTEAVNGKAKASRGDYTASEDDNVLVQGVSRDKGGLGYFGYAYYIENKNKLTAVPIVNSKGKAVLPSNESVLRGEYNPLARPLFIYVVEKSLERPEVKKFVDFYFQEVTALAKEVKYVPLPAAAYSQIKKNIAAKRTGTVFGGESDVGVTVDEILTKETQH